MSDIFNQALAGKRGKHQQLIAEAVAREWGELLLRKNHDYGSAVFDPPVLAPDIPASLAIQVRLSDKIGRIKNLLDNPAEVSEESIDDSIFDYAAYRLLQRIANRLESPELSDVAEVQADDPPEATTEEAPRKIVYIDGITYEVPDGRDIGKLAWACSQSTASACRAQVSIRIADYRPDDRRPYVSSSGSEWKYAVLVPEAKEAAEEAPREIVYVDGIAYEIPDSRDIGKLALVSSQSTANACLSQVCIRIADYRPDDGRPYVTAAGAEWEYAVLVPEEASDE